MVLFRIKFCITFRSAFSCFVSNFESHSHQFFCKLLFRIKFLHRFFLFRIKFRIAFTCFASVFSHVTFLHQVLQQLFLFRIAAKTDLFSHWCEKNLHQFHIISHQCEKFRRTLAWTYLYMNVLVHDGTCTWRYPCKRVPLQELTFT